MAQRAGSFIFRGGQFLLEGLQSAGPDNLNIPSEKLNEVGNEQSVVTTFDIPDLSFAAETVLMNCDLEAILTRVDPTSVTDHQAFDFTGAKPLDIVSPWKGAYGTFITVAGVAVPYLLLEQISYRAGVRANATTQVTLRGDSIYYCQKTPYFKTFSSAAVTGLGVGPYTFDHTAVKTIESGDNVYAYCVTIHHSDGTWTRLLHGSQYTDTSSGFTLVDAPTAGDTIDVVYASATTESDPQNISSTYDEKHRPFRARDVTLTITDSSATPQTVEWSGVQNVEATWRVTLDPDEELGNPHYVARDYDVPEVSGSVALRPATAAALMTKLAQLQQVDNTTDTLNTTGFSPVELEIGFNDPVSGDRTKTVYVEDARFSPPPVGVRVGQKADFTLPWSSDTGSMKVYNGERP